ncbi:MAG: 16S rRNA (adenine(1518)-N(6)/adenine(1519)-N(6))-dimethyltransferase RsmA [Deinococcales bacterium]
MRSSSTSPNPLSAHELLKRYQLKADKSFGQNFLIDANALQAIVEAADISPDDHALEIGPGLGVLTRELCLRAKQVTSIELDKRLIPILKEHLAAFDHLNLIQADALDYDFHYLPADSLLVANLPYNVATTILSKALASGRFKRLVFLVQKEVAERLKASNADSSYGALSLITQYYGKVSLIRHIKPAAFLPPPKVMSSIVKVDVINQQADQALFDFIYLTFKHRRKTLKKNLLMAGYAPQRVQSAFLKLDLNEQLRAEALDLARFQALFQELTESVLSC